MQSNIAPDGMVVTPHHLATQTAVLILQRGGTAMEAIVAAAATIAVVYPHMNTIGGDGFWLIIPPHGEPIVIEASGAAGSLATEDFFKGYDKIPYKGPKAALTVPGTVGGWQEVLNYATENGYSKFSRHELLADAIKYAENGFPVTESFRHSLITAANSNSATNYFAEVFLPGGQIPNIGEKFYQKQLGHTLRALANEGFNSFYNGSVAEKIMEDIAQLGLPITDADLKNYSPIRKVPLHFSHSLGELYNIPPPTQGLVSLIIHGILDRLNVDGKNEGELIHTAVEATKEAFKIRDKYITDPLYMHADPKYFLSNNVLCNMSKNINFNQSSSTDKQNGPGDTVWLGAMDNKGFTVGFIQSIYHEFGSGMFLPKTGILWHNRGATFNLQKDSILYVEPGKKPFTTLTVAAAKMYDGRVMIYGTRGGNGQPQTQAAIFYRYAIQNMTLQASISAPRWLFGSTSGKPEDILYLESRFREDTIQYLKDRGHKVNLLPAYSEQVGQAGALVRHPNGVKEGAFDPRSDGSAAGF